MIHALGYSTGEFRPDEPGRLCRGRERWVDSYTLNEPPLLHRLVVSGASFTDDSARDARRGLRFSGVTAELVAGALYPDALFVAWAEDAPPSRVPEGAGGLEHYPVRRPGGALEEWAARWSFVTDDPADLTRAMAAGADAVMVLRPDQTLDDEREGSAPTPEIGDAPLADHYLEQAHRGGLPEWLRQLLFLLTGHRLHGAPCRNFQPAAVAEVLEHCRALLLLHQDKHAPCLGIYAADPVDTGPLLALTADAEALAVPFAIPPMLARWDRALAELRQDWDEARVGPFPVPRGPERGSGWGRRGPGSAQASESSRRGKKRGGATRGREPREVTRQEPAAQESAAQEPNTREPAEAEAQQDATTEADAPKDQPSPGDVG